MKIYAVYDPEDENEARSVLTPGFDLPHSHEILFRPKELDARLAAGMTRLDMRDLCLRDSTVTVVLVGLCTWSRIVVDWEIQASLSSNATTAPNGLLAIELLSASREIRHVYYGTGRGESVLWEQHALWPPDRLFENLGGDAAYARFVGADQIFHLDAWLGDAERARIQRRAAIRNNETHLTDNYDCTGRCANEAHKRRYRPRIWAGGSGEYQPLVSRRLGNIVSRRPVP